MSNYYIEHNCPQCGGPATIEETDRVFKCGFCKVSLFIIPKDYLKYYILPKSKETEDTYYIPYWRLKGITYTCIDNNITKQIVERSYRAVNINYIAFSLGYRTQTQKMRFVPSEHLGRFIAQDALNNKYIYSIDEANIYNSELTRIHHRAFIGEAISIIYSPYQLKNRDLYDAILNKKIHTLDDDGLETLQKMSLTSGWQVRFMPTLCPNCGWDLIGQGDSVVFRCTNCDTLWDITKDQYLNQVKYYFLPPMEKNMIYLPFWRLDVRFDGLRLQTFSDIARLANIPKVHKPIWDETKPYFWTPAFKVTPEVFMRLTRHLTLTEETLKITDDHQDLKIVSDINLSLNSAFESVKITLANISSDRKNFYPRLRDIEVSLNEAVIVYIPFRQSLNELLQDRLKCSIHKNNIKTAKRL